MTYFKRTKLKFCVGALILLGFYCLNVECKRIGGGGSRTWGSRPASRPSTPYRPAPSRPVSHPSPASLSYPPSHHPAPSPSQNTRPIGFGSPSSSSSNQNTRPIGSPSPSYGFGTGGTSNQKPIGFEKVKPLGSSSGGGAQGPPSTNFGFGSAGGSSPGKLGFENVKPVGSAAAGAHKTGSGHPTSGTGTHGSGHPSTGTGTHGSPSGSGNPPSYGWNVNQGHGSPAGNTKPSAPSEHSVNSKPLGNTNPSAPVGPPSNVKPVGNAAPGAPYQIHPPPYSPHNPGVAPPAYHPTHNAAGYGAPPAYSGYGPPAAPGYGHNPGYGYGHHPPGAGYGSPGGITNVNINNINTNTHYGGGHYGGGGFGGGFGGFGGGYSYPSYSYTSREVGSGALGFFLGYSLAKLTTPTFHYSAGSYSGYTPRYDHYEVHHYYHNRDSVPPQKTIEPNAIVGCVGDSGSICPPGTTSLCTNNGAILCVASATSTVPCTDVKGANCVQSVVPCVNGTHDGCKAGENKTVTIPCISKAEVPGNITYVNNTIISVNNTTVYNNFNGNGTLFNSTVRSEVGNGTTISTTALPVNGTTLLSNVTSDGVRMKREAAHVNEFCVTILALPAERKPSEQEQLVDKSTDIFAKFLVRALGVN